MVYIGQKDFKTESDAMLWREKYYENWHPAGYGTVINISQEEDGTWSCSGHRGSSCD